MPPKCEMWDVGQSGREERRGTREKSTSKEVKKDIVLEATTFLVRSARLFKLCSTKQHITKVERTNPRDTFWLIPPVCSRDSESNTELSGQLQWKQQMIFPSLLNENLIILHYILYSLKKCWLPGVIQPRTLRCGRLCYYNKQWQVLCELLALTLANRKGDVPPFEKCLY